MQDMRKWREEHGMTAAAVRKLLDSEASDEALTPAVEEARHQLAAHFQVHADSGQHVDHHIAEDDPAWTLILSRHSHNGQTFCACARRCVHLR